MNELVVGGKTFEAIWDQCTKLVKSGLLPVAINTPEKALAVALKGHEIGIPLMQAFAHIHIINGKPTMSSELMLVMIYKHHPHAILEFDSTDTYCSIKSARSAKHPIQTFRFSWDDAKRADLLKKTTWNQYPRAMLKARAISEMARTVFPDALCGISYTPEELGAEVAMNDDGIIDVVVEKKDDKKQETKNETGSQHPIVNIPTSYGEMPFDPTKKDMLFEFGRAMNANGLKKDEMSEEEIRKIATEMIGIKLKDLKAAIDDYLKEKAMEFLNKPPTAEDIYGPEGKWTAD